MVHPLAGLRVHLRPFPFCCDPSGFQSMRASAKNMYEPKAASSCWSLNSNAKLHDMRRHQITSCSAIYYDTLPCDITSGVYLRIARLVRFPTPAPAPSEGEPSPRQRSPRDRAESVRGQTEGAETHARSPTCVRAGGLADGQAGARKRTCMRTPQ